MEGVLGVLFAILLTTRAQIFASNYTPAARCDLPIHPIANNANIKQFGRSTFVQPLHHQMPDLGTFELALYWNITYWAGPGSPIVVWLPGETKADRHLVHSRPEFSIVGVIAENLGAAVLVPEHRYYGSSSPFSQLTTSNLSYLTVENALLDVVGLAEHFTPPWTNTSVNSTAKEVPWILIGGSYSAAQAAWIANVYGGTYWAYLSLSPIVQSITSYWQYYLPEVEYGRQLCSTLLDRMINFIDDLFETGSKSQSQAIKDLFGLSAMDNESFLFQITIPVTFWARQDVGSASTRYEWLCDRVEGIDQESSELHLLPPEILALLSSETNINKRADWNSDHLQMLRALYQYAEGFRREIAPILCLGAFCSNELDPTDSRYYQLLVENSIDRQMKWLQCNDLVGGYIVGAPTNETTLVSRLTTTEFFHKQCALYFPPGPNGEAFGASQGRTAEALNAYTGGWNPANARRIIYSSGGRDVWREMGVSAERRPGGPMKSNPEMDMVVHIIETGFHHSELSTLNAELNEEVRRTRDLEVAQICRWVQEWPGYL